MAGRGAGLGGGEGTSNSRWNLAFELLRGLGGGCLLIALHLTVSSASGCGFCGLTTS